MSELTYEDKDGHTVYTSAYLKNRGTCCKTCCLHCPYGHTLKTEGLNFEVVSEERLEEAQNILDGGAGSSRESSHPQPEQVRMPNEEAPMEKSDEEPRILNMKVYHGMKDGKPDHGKVLFYEDPDGCIFDCENQEWMSHKPEYINHLNSRPMQYSETDIIAAIANGVMDDNDYDSLEKAGMLSESPRKLWASMGKLKSLVDQYESAKETEPMEKSDDEPTDLGEKDSDEEENSPESPESDSLEPESAPETQSAPDGEEGDMAGNDMFKEMMESALKAALAGPELERRIREIVAGSSEGKPEENPNVAPQESSESQESSDPVEKSQTPKRKKGKKGKKLKDSVDNPEDAE